MNKLSYYCCIFLFLCQACIKLKHSSTPYNQMIANDCTGRALLAATYQCVNGKWAKLPSTNVANKENPPRIFANK